MAKDDNGGGLGYMCMQMGLCIQKIWIIVATPTNSYSDINKTWHIFDGHRYHLTSHKMRASERSTVGLNFIKFIKSLRNVIDHILKWSTLGFLIWEFLALIQPKLKWSPDLTGPLNFLAPLSGQNLV